MTVRDWIGTRTPPAPDALASQLFALLGDDANAPEERTADACLGAASRSLAALLAGRRYERDSALELLAIDALTTYALEHASQRLRTSEDLEALATRSALLLAKLAATRD